MQINHASTNNVFMPKIKIGRLMLAIVFVFIVADSVPHPALSEGILQTLFSRNTDLQQTRPLLAE